MSLALRPVGLARPLAPLTLPLSRLVAGAGAAALGAIFGLLSSGGGGRAPCDMCGGAGYVAGASGRRRCPRCRGGGTHIPALGVQPIPVRITDGFRHAAAALFAAPIVLRPAFRRRAAGAPVCLRAGRVWRPA